MSKFNFYFLLIPVFVFVSCNKKEILNYKIGFSQTGLEDDWRKSMNQSMKIQVGFYPDIELVILDGEDNITKQINDIKKLIKEDIDILIVSPIKSEPITSVVEKAYKKGIPVIIVDRKIEGENYTAYIGGDNYEVGKNAATYLASISSSRKRIIEIKGLSGSSPARERSLGFNNSIKANKKLEVIKSLESNWESYSIKDSLKLVLDNYENIDYIFAHNDRLALGAWQIAKEKGLQDSLHIIGVDGLPGYNGGIKLVEEGKLIATILYPTGGSETIKLSRKILNGEAVPKNNILNTTIIDSRNAGIMKNQYKKISQQQNDIEEQQQKIKVQAKTYMRQSITLKLVLTLLILSIILGIYSIYFSSKLRTKKRELELQNKKITIQRNQIRKIADEVKKSNKAKTNFFTNLSHEFKTPITLILSSIESLSENKIIKENNLISDVGLMYNNSKRLLRLINQLLDFRKIENKKFILKASETNLYKFSKSIFSDFEREARKRNIYFSLESNNKDLNVFIDRNLMDKVYFNLLSNAIKFTPNNGKIKISINDDETSDIVKIHFRDSGIGIPKDEINNVFNAFFQGSNNNKVSSGIGLHLSKEFVELHKGEIEINSMHGTEFVISLYKGKAHLDKDQIIYEPDWVDDDVFNFGDFEEDSLIMNIETHSDVKYSILIIEDNQDLVNYLNQKLSLSYKVDVSNGLDGVQKAVEIIPDVIICDINISGNLNGFDICSTLKKDLRTSHIPIIILTAHNNKESYIQGLESGADLYLTKPFSFSILFQSVKSVLFNREKLRYYYINNINQLDTADSFGQIEQDFISKIDKIIEDNLDNSNFTVELMAEELNMSRVQLYRKMKAISGISISDFILNTRLEKAKLMLRDSKLSISEIAYATGFSSPNYFSTSFKNKFNKTPKAFRSNKV